MAYRVSRSAHHPDRAFQSLPDSHAAGAGRIPTAEAFFRVHLSEGRSPERLARDGFLRRSTHGGAGTDREMAKVVESVKGCAALRARGAAAAPYLRPAATGGQVAP